jgi:hypothetical protein
VKVQLSTEDMLAQLGDIFNLDMVTRYREGRIYDQKDREARFERKAAKRAVRQKVNNFKRNYRRATDE